jgi:hypothetical protein
MESWTDSLGATYEVDRLFQVRCSCGKGATGSPLKVTIPPDPPKVTRWFRPPAHWFVALTGDLKRIDDGKAIEGPFVRCPACLGLSPIGEPRDDSSPE